MNRFFTIIVKITFAAAQTNTRTIFSTRTNFTSIATATTLATIFAATTVCLALRSNTAIATLTFTIYSKTSTTGISFFLFFHYGFFLFLLRKYLIFFKNYTSYKIISVFILVFI